MIIAKYYIFPIKKWIGEKESYGVGYGIISKENGSTKVGAVRNVFISLEINLKEKWFKKKDMDLQEKSYTELEAMFQAVALEWQAINLRINRVKIRECEKYSEFVACRAELRRLAKENAKLHNILVRIDLELQIRVWTGKND